MENTGEVAARAGEFLDWETIRERVRCVAELLERLAPLAQNKSALWRPKLRLAQGPGPLSGRKLEDGWLSKRG